MKSFIPKQRGFVSLIIIFFGIFLGVYLSSPENKLFGSIIGLAISCLVSYFIIAPDIKSIQNALISRPSPKEANIKETGFNFTIDYHNFFWHPTRIPIFIGAFWFIFN